MEQLTAEALVGEEPSEPAVCDANARITAADRSLARLLGAAGFASDGPAGASHASELLADTYVGGGQLAMEA